MRRLELWGLHAELVVCLLVVFLILVAWVVVIVMILLRLIALFVFFGRASVILLFVPDVKVLVRGALLLGAYAAPATAHVLMLLFAATPAIAFPATLWWPRLSIVLLLLLGCLLPFVFFHKVGILLGRSTGVLICSDGGRIRALRVLHILQHFVAVHLHLPEDALLRRLRELLGRVVDVASEWVLQLFLTLG